MSYFIRAGIQLVDVDRIQSVTVQPNGVLNVLVGEDTENGVIVVIAREEARQSPFFRQFYEPQNGKGKLRGSVNLPRKDSKFGRPLGVVDADGNIRLSGSVSTDQPDRFGDVITKEALEKLREENSYFKPVGDFDPLKFIAGSLADRIGLEEDKAYLGLGKSQVSKELQCSCGATGEHEHRLFCRSLGIGGVGPDYTSNCDCNGFSHDACAKKVEEAENRECICGPFDGCSDCPLVAEDCDGDIGPTYPEVGDRVYYYAYGTPKGEFPQGVARAAIVTEVDDTDNPTSAVGLAVLNPTGLFFNQHIPYGPGKPGHWGWAFR